jgi:hypothetical protein
MSAMQRPDTAAWDGLNDTQQAVLTCAWRISKPGGMVLTKQICGRTGLSKSCVNDAIHVLLDRGLWVWRRMSRQEAGKLGAAKSKRWANHCKIMDVKEECDYIPTPEEIEAGKSLARFTALQRKRSGPGHADYRGRTGARVVTNPMCGSRRWNGQTINR